MIIHLGIWPLFLNFQLLIKIMTSLRRREGLETLPSLNLDRWSLERGEKETWMILLRSYKSKLERQFMKIEKRIFLESRFFGNFFPLFMNVRTEVRSEWEYSGIISFVYSINVVLELQKRSFISMIILSHPNTSQYDCRSWVPLYSESNYDLETKKLDQQTER